MQVVGGDAEALHVLGWQVDAPPGGVLGHVLEMLQHLQPAAHFVGGRNSVGGGRLEDGENEVSHGVGRQRAVLEELVEVLVAGLVLVEPVGGQQLVEWLAVQAEPGHRRRELDEHLMSGGPGEQAVELGLDPVESRLPVAGVLVAEVVDEPGVAVDGSQVALHGSRQQPERHREVLMAGPGHDRLEADMALNRLRGRRLIGGLRLRALRWGRAVRHSVH